MTIGHNESRKVFGEVIMTLEKICEDIAEVIYNLMYNDDISVSWKADILDDILATIGSEVAEGIEPSLDSVKDTLTQLIDFQESYDVDLESPINNLKKFVESMLPEEEK